MGRYCLACAHPEHEEIDLALMLHQDSYRRIAARYGLSGAGVRRHFQICLGLSWQLSKELQAMLAADNLLAELGDLQRETREVLAEAKKANDQRLRLLAIREGRNNVEAFRDTHIKLDEHDEFEQRLAALEHLVNGDDETP